MSSPWAKFSDNNIEPSSPTFPSINFTPELKLINRWGHHQVNNHLFASIPNTSEANIYMPLRRSRKLRGIHNEVMGGIHMLLHTQQSYEEIINCFSETLKPDITSENEWPLALTDCIRRIESIDQKFDSRDTYPTDIQKAEYVTHLYAAFMEHGSKILNVEDYHGYVPPQMLENIGVKAEILGNTLPFTKDIDAVFSCHASREQLTPIQEGYKCLANFLDNKLTILEFHIRKTEIKPSTFDSFTDDANEAFQDLLWNTVSYKNFLTKLKRNLQQIKDDGLWPSLYEEAAYSFAQNAEDSNELPSITKETGIGKFIEETLYANRHTEIHPKNAQVLIGILSMISKKFPSPSFKKLGLDLV